MIFFLHKIEKGLTALFLLSLLLAFNAPCVCAMMLLCITLHELGHLFAYRLLAVRTGRVRFGLGGLVIPYEGRLCYRDEILIAAMGPIFNGICALVCLLLLPLGRDFFLLFAMLHLLYALSNLLPLPSYDGEKILGGVLSIRFGDEVRCRVLGVLSFLIRSLLLFLSLFFIFLYNALYHIFFVFFLSLLPSLAKGLSSKKD